VVGEGRRDLDNLQLLPCLSGLHKNAGQHVSHVPDHPMSICYGAVSCPDAQTHEMAQNLGTFCLDLSRKRMSSRMVAPTCPSEARMPDRRLPAMLFETLVDKLKSQCQFHSKASDSGDGPRK
jgi:hypothetical protein